MNGPQQFAAAAVAIALVACAPMSGAAASQGPCEERLAQNLLGRPFDEALAEQARLAANARSVRTIGPGQAVTMDYRPDRLNVEYDESGRVTAIGCG